MMTLESALDGWAAVQRPTGPHPDRPALYELLIGKAEGRETLLRHVDGCPVCLATLGELGEAIDAGLRHADWDLALPKAAAPARDPAAQRIPTEGGRFTIDVRRHTTMPRRALVTIQVSERFRDALEGRRLCLRDASGRTVLEGVVVSGEVSQEVSDAGALDGGLVVQTQP